MSRYPMLNYGAGGGGGGLMSMYPSFGFGGSGGDGGGFGGSPWHGGLSYGSFGIPSYGGMSPLGSMAGLGMYGR